jgi:hypothetical protein
LRDPAGRIDSKAVFDAYSDGKTSARRLRLATSCVVIWTSTLAVAPLFTVVWDR